MKTARLLPLLGFLAAVGCYHATINTATSPGTKVIDKPWTASWLFGLVPPATVNAAAECGTGVARVETQHSFLNYLVGGLTLGIYTPISIKVTCAAGRGGGSAGESSLGVREDAPPAVFESVFAAAAEEAVSSREPVYVRIAPASSNELH